MIGRTLTDMCVMIFTMSHAYILTFILGLEVSVPRARTRRETGTFAFPGDRTRWKTQFETELAITSSDLSKIEKFAVFCSRKAYAFATDRYDSCRSANDHWQLLLANNRS